MSITIGELRWSFVNNSTMRHISNDTKNSMCGIPVDEIFVEIGSRRIFEGNIIIPIKMFNECPECCHQFNLMMNS